MSKLIRAYQQSPYAPQARALLAYLNKHMMAECMATADEQLVIQHVRSINWH
jgi:outer membrane protein assembly factor BamD (BamD/ComL family)